VEAAVAVLVDSHWWLNEEEWLALPVVGNISEQKVCACLPTEKTMMHIMTHGNSDAVYFTANDTRKML